MSIDNAPDSQYQKEREVVGQIKELERINLELQKALKASLKVEAAPGEFDILRKKAPAVGKESDISAQINRLLNDLQSLIEGSCDFESDGVASGVGAIEIFKKMFTNLVAVLDKRAN